MTETSELDPRIRCERDPETHIARLTIDNPTRRNAYDPPMRRAMRAHLDELATDDDIKVVLLRGAEGVFSTGADMANSYSWYGDDPNGRRPSQRRRLGVDRESFGFYHELMAYPKVTVAQVETYALGGGFEIALMADLAVVGHDAKLGMPGARLLGPALGNLHLFFHRLGPVLSRRLLLTGDTITGRDVEHLGVFTEVVDDAAVTARAEWWAQKVARMPADGIVMAKEAFRLVEQLQAYQGEEVASYLFHAFGTNLQFEDDEFNFVKLRAKHGTKGAFEMRDAHFDVPEPR